METYANWAPTQFDTRGLSLDGRQDWFVVGVIRTRDSDALERSNFEVALRELGGESETVEVHRFGHWGPGWFEIIIVAPGSPAEAIGHDIVRALRGYPVLSDEDFSEKEYEEAGELWEQASVIERLMYINRCGADPKVSIFAARRPELPEGIYVTEMLY